MKILQINTVYGEGSTGKIVKEIHDVCLENGIDCLSAHRCVEKGKTKYEDTIEISSWIDSRLHGRLAKYTMFKGFFSKKRTKAFIKKIVEYAPDIVHLHNLHGSYINIPILFNYLEKENIPIIWTLHDCWAFTGICSHFTLAKCDKWKYGCYECPQKAQFSTSLIDFSYRVWELKKKYFTKPKNLVIVTPSNWLENLVRDSFFRSYDVKTIYNGINLDVFQPTYSDFRVRHDLENKKIVLGVAFDWGYKKGLDVFVKLSNILPNNYIIVLVGINNITEQILPSNIISISRTNDQKELAEIYTVADVFVNATREEVLGLVNLEALACGTPVITYNTGGSPECIDSSCGVVIQQNDVETLKKEIIRVVEEKNFLPDACINRAKMFNKKIKVEEYIKLYEERKK